MTTDGAIVMAEKNNIRLTYPDGSSKELASGVTGAQVAAGIGRRLAQDALAIRVDGQLRDLSMPIVADAPIEIVTFDSPQGREVFWHSSAHVMAQAVTEVVPGTKLAIGPPIA